MYEVTTRPPETMLQRLSYTDIKNLMNKWGGFEETNEIRI